MDYIIFKIRHKQQIIKQKMYKNYSSHNIGLSSKLLIVKTRIIRAETRVCTRLKPRISCNAGFLFKWGSSFYLTVYTII